MNIPGGWELIVVVAVIMVLFGYKRLPDATRSLGKSMRIFKAETKGLREDGTPETTTTAQQVVTPAVTPAAPVVPPVVTPPAAPVHVDAPHADLAAEQAPQPRP